MDFQIKIVEALVDLLKTGGNYAIWGIIAWWIMNLLKIAIVSIVTFCSLRLLVTLATHWITIKELSNKDKVSLISQQCSDNLVSLVKDFQAETTKAMKDFLKDAEGLLKKPTDTQEKQ